MGFGVLALGTVIALLPESSFAFAAAKVPADASTTTMLLLACCCCSAGVARAQHVDSQQPRRASSLRARRSSGRWDARSSACAAPAGDSWWASARAGRPPRCARRSRKLVTEGKNARPDRRVLRAEVRQPGAAGGSRSTRASTGSRGCSPTCSGPAGLVRRRGVATRWSQRDSQARRARPTAERSRRRHGSSLRGESRR